MTKYGINCRRKIELYWTGTIIPTTNNSSKGYNNQQDRNTEANATLWTIIYNFQREDALSWKTVVNSVTRVTDTNPENFAERQKDRRLIPDQEHGIDV